MHANLFSHSSGHVSEMLENPSLKVQGSFFSLVLRDALQSAMQKKDPLNLQGSLYDTGDVE